MAPNHPYRRARATSTPSEFEIGRVYLCDPLLPLVECEILAMSAAGCRVAMRAGAIEPRSQEPWRRALVPGRPLRLQIDLPPMLHRFELKGWTLDVNFAGDNVTITIGFQALTPPQSLILKMAYNEASHAARSMPQGELPSEIFANPSPTPIPFLVSVDALRSSQRKTRHIVRYALSEPLRYQFCTEKGEPLHDTPLTGRVVSLSEDALQVEIDPSRLGSPADLQQRNVCLNLSIPAGEVSCRMTCQIRSIKEQDAGDGQGAKWLASVSVSLITAENRRRLKSVCAAAAAKAMGARRKNQ